MHRVSATLSILGLFATGCGGTTTMDSASTAAESAPSSMTTTSAAPLTPAAPAVRAATRAAEEKFAVRMQADAARTTVARVESP